MACVTLRVRIFFRNSCCGHLHSQVKSLRQMIVFMPLFLVLIAQFCRDVIVLQNEKLAVIRLFLFDC